MSENRVLSLVVLPALLRCGNCFHQLFCSHTQTVPGPGEMLLCDAERGNRLLPGDGTDEGVGVSGQPACRV